MLGYDFWIQLVVVLIALFYGARKGGMALGLIGGIGLLVLVFGFGVKPGKPPVDVILTILAVSAVLQRFRLRAVLTACFRSQNAFCVVTPVRWFMWPHTSAGS